MKKFLFFVPLCAALVLSSCKDKDEAPAARSTTAGFTASACEVDEIAGTVEIPVSIGDEMRGDVVFTVEAEDGTAVSVGDNRDYKLKAGEVTIVKGGKEGRVLVELQDSYAQKEDRAFTLKITAVRAAYEADEVALTEALKTCEVTIRKVVREASFVTSELAVDASMSPVGFGVSLTGPVEQDVTITFAPKEGGTAKEGVHYTLGTHQLTIKKGEMQATTSLTILKNAVASCDFEITEVTGNVDVAMDAVCKLDIRRTPGSVILELDKAAYTFEKGKSGTLVATVYSDSAENQVAWSSSDLSVATVSAAGEVTALKVGQTTVTATSSGQSVTCKVGVVPALTASASDEASVSGNEGGAAYLIDGNTDTYWHSQWEPTIELPHWVQVDLGMECEVNKVEMWRRPGTNNDVKVCTLLIGTDGVTWTDIETYSYSEPTDKYRLHEFVPAQKARYVRFHISESARPPFAGVAEIKVDRSYCFD